jgi:dihydrofolate synthase/folylpolyglutamate synthase
LPQKAIYYFTRASVERALNEKILANQAEAHGLNGKSFSSVKEAVEAAKENADKNDLIFIGGSSFVVADALPLFT